LGGIGGRRGHDGLGKVKGRRRTAEVTMEKRGERGKKSKSKKKNEKRK
jgi:hypothetical protein